MRKLLKYDVKSVFKFWWIAALAMLGVAALGGTSLRMLIALDYSSDDPLTVASGFSGMAGVMASYIGLFAYLLVITFFLLRRFYCHFFTDEGYLTFTLPVTRRQLLTSKVLMAWIYDALNWVVILASVALFFVVGLAGTGIVSLSDITYVCGRIFSFLSDECGIFLPIYAVEGVLMMIASSLFSTLFAYLCITIGAIVAKKQKVLAAVGIYYGGTTVLSFISQIAFSLLFSFNIPFLEYFTGSTEDLTILALLGLGLLLLMVGLVVLLYWLVLRLLHKKLNLA